jgi:hypothetical protein
VATPLRLDGLLAKIESTYGTDPTPVAATDGVRVSERVWSTIAIEHVFLGQRNAAAGSLSPIAPAARKGRKVTMEIAWEARGTGAAYSASVLPEADPLFRACGTARTDDFTAGSEIITYAQADTGLESCTIYAYAGNKLFKVVGCRGSIRWPVEVGGLGIIRFSMEGILTAAPTEVALPSVTYDAVIPPPAVGMSLTVAAWSPDVLSAEFDQAATIARIDSANAADGIVSFDISEVTPVYNLSAKAPAISTYDPYTIMQAATAQTISQTLGSVQYNRMKLDVTSAAYLQSIAHSDQDGFAGIDLVYALTSFALKFD